MTSILDFQAMQVAETSFVLPINGGLELRVTLGHVDGRRVFGMVVTGPDEDGVIGEAGQGLVLPISYLPHLLSGLSFALGDAIELDLLGA